MHACACVIIVHIFHLCTEKTNTHNAHRSTSIIKTERVALLFILCHHFSAHQRIHIYLHQKTPIDVFPPLQRYNENHFYLCFVNAPVCIKKRKKTRICMCATRFVLNCTYFWAYIKKETVCIQERKRHIPTFAGKCTYISILFLGHMQCSSTFPKSAKIYAYI